MSGLLFVVLGAVVVIRTLAATGLSWAALPACVLGAAMLALGWLRFRDYLAARKA